MTNFNGRLFAGRLYAGRLFRGPRRDDQSPGPDPIRSDARRRTDFNDDELIELAVALILSGALDG